MAEFLMGVGVGWSIGCLTLLALDSWHRISQRLAAKAEAKERKQEHARQYRAFVDAPAADTDPATEAEDGEQPADWRPSL